MGLRLKGQGPGGVALQAHPALLERVGGVSRWGDFAYRPVLARQGRRVTREHRLQLALWGRLLADHQRSEVPQGLVVAGDGRGFQRESLSLGAGLQHQLEDTLVRLQGDLQRKSPPALVSDRKKCTLCSWRGLCDQAAATEGHLSEVSGIGGKRRELLLELGIGTLAVLAGTDPEQLATRLEVHGEQHREIAAQLVAQALVQQHGRPERLDSALALSELNGSPGLLLYDIESDPDARDDFLHGFVVVKRLADGSWPVDLGDSRYQPLLALFEHGEALLWQRLRRLLDHYPGWPVLHYGETESIGLVRLAQRQGASDAEIGVLRSRLIDVHARLKRSWRLPVSSYGLKAVASWLGFAWSQKGVDGARCLLWWRQWRYWRHEPGPRGRASRYHLDRIFCYNRDDNLATWAVAHWLWRQDSKRVGEPGSSPA
jgi:uncharacterized protein